MQPIIELREIRRQYAIGAQIVNALDGVSLSVAPGEFVAIMGPSGSGKSTAMNIIGCLDKPTSGQYSLDGYDTNHLNDDELATLRNSKIGFVFQNFNLLSRTTALENVELPMVYAGLPPKERRLRAVEALQRVGLGEHLDNRPNQLSGGQQQRVSIARAVVNHPALILADEPTGALDSRTSADILGLFEELNSQGNTIVIVTHDPSVGRRAKRIFHFLDGRLTDGHESSGADRDTGATVARTEPRGMEQTGGEV